MRVLAGDIGGTKTAIATIEIAAGRCAILREERYPSAEHATLEAILEKFLSTERRRPAAAGFGVAGPVRDGRSRITNLPWRLDEKTLSRTTGIRRLVLVNDFGANARGLRYLGPRQVATLWPGRPEKGGPVAILGAGTGLGQAGVLADGDQDAVVASEAGHVDFGPRTAEQDRLVSFLRARFGRATRERILSGSGLALIHEFLAGERRARPSRTVAAELAAADDRAAVISRLGLARRDPLSRAALDLFVAIYGSEAGNTALQYRATGGVYIAGGIAPKILPALRRPAFLQALHDKAPMTELIMSIPVRVVLDPNLGLYGAAAAALSTAAAE